MNIKDIDFEGLYVAQKSQSSFKPKTKEEWNSKADDLNSVVKNDLYIETLLKKIDVSECESLLDVGCGAGTVCINLKDSVKSAIAIDYAESMLDRLRQRIGEECASHIEPRLVSWEDSWEDIPPCDVVVASRSMQVADMGVALKKLNDKAKKRVYITTKAGGTFLPREIYGLLDKKVTPNPDYIYIVNILYKMGIDPRLDYIEMDDDMFSKRSEEGFLRSIEWSMGGINEGEKERLREFYATKLKDIKPKIKWALISWEK